MGGAWDNLAYSGQMLKEFTVFFYFCRDGRRLLDDVFVKQLKVPNNKITTPQHFCIFHLCKDHEASIQKQNHSNIQLGPFFDYNHLKFKPNYKRIQFSTNFLFEEKGHENEM